MDLSTTIASIAVVLAVILAAGHAYGEEIAPVVGKPTAQEKVTEREAQRRAAVQEQQKRKDAFDRACSRPMKSDSDFELCKSAYKKLHLIN